MFFWIDLPAVIRERSALSKFRHGEIVTWPATLEPFPSERLVFDPSCSTAFRRSPVPFVRGIFSGLFRPPPFPRLAFKEGAMSLVGPGGRPASPRAVRRRRHAFGLLFAAFGCWRSAHGPATASRRSRCRRSRQPGFANRSCPVTDLRQARLPRGHFGSQDAPVGFCPPAVKAARDPIPARQRGIAAGRGPFQ